MRISVVGLGKLGTPLAAWIASKGFGVIGVDVNPAPVMAIRQRRAYVPEPGLQEILDWPELRLWAVPLGQLRWAIQGTSITFIAVPTPSEEGGAFSLAFVEKAARDIGRAIAKKASYHLVVVVSTVMPGHMAQVQAALEAAGNQHGVDFGLCYNPSFIALGNVIQGLGLPDFVLIGQGDERAGQLLEELYIRMFQLGWEMRSVDRSDYPPVWRTNFINAELAKLSLNAYITTKISFANMLSGLCEAFPGADVDQVTRAIGLDSRIGRKCLWGGVGFGGPCFPRDNVALQAAARQAKAGPLYLPRVVEDLNDTVFWRIQEAIRQRTAPRGSIISVLGLAYKPGTPVVENSQGWLLFQQHLAGAWHMMGYDPLLAGPDSLESCLEYSDIVVVMLPLDEFRRLDIPEGSNVRVVIDPWRIVDPICLPPGVEYVPMGRGKEEA